MAFARCLAADGFAEDSPLMELDAVDDVVRFVN